MYESPITLEPSGEIKAAKFSALPREDILPYLDPVQEHSFDLSQYITADINSNNIKSVNIPVSIDSVLAAPTSHQLDTKVLSPVRLDFPSTYGLTTSTYMPEYEPQTSGSDDSQPEWKGSTVKSEDLAYSPASSDADSSFAPLTVVESPTSPSDHTQPHRRSSGKGGRKRSVEKGTSEYVEKRARNNVAVRKSRAKAKEKQKSTESKVQILMNENEQLQKKVDLLTKELHVLKGLFINVGTTIPDSFAKLLEQWRK